MRRIIIPQEALDRHEEKLGKAVLGYLKRLAEGKRLTWPKSDKVKSGSYIVQTNWERLYWGWVWRRFERMKMLVAPPQTLLLFAKENEIRLSRINLFVSSNQMKSISDGIRHVSQALFNYYALRTGNVLNRENGERIRWSHAKKKIQNWGGWSLAEYVRLLDIHYCPYCNAETVGLVQRMNPKAKTPVAYSALDHILPKSKHPLLALSLYNLVPACTKCNSQLKHESDEFDVGNWDPNNPFNALHPYTHNIHKWFRFVYRPSSVTELFLNPQKSQTTPLSIERRIPLPNNLQKPFDYDSRTKQYTTQYELPGSYYDLYAAEINEMIRMEMICTPTFEQAMRDKGLSDEDFNIAFRRTSLDPREINEHRFSKLIIDLHQQIGRDELPKSTKGKTL